MESCILTPWFGMCPESQVSCTGTGVEIDPVLLSLDPLGSPLIKHMPNNHCKFPMSLMPYRDPKSSLNLFTAFGEFPAIVMSSTSTARIVASSSNL